MKVLGLSAFERDAAAALVVDRKFVAAAQEERFSRKRGDRDFPRRAVQACLDVQGLIPEDLDRVVFYERPLRKFERVLVSQLRGFPRSAGSFSRTMFAWFGERLWVKNQIAEYLGLDREKISFTDTALAHAANALHGSGFESSAILVLDDVGEWTTTWLGRGDGEGLHPLREQRFPHSLGLFASSVAQYLGFEPGVDEQLVASLARFGQPAYRAAFERWVEAGEQGSFALELEAFRFVFDDRLWFSQAFVDEFGPERRPGGEIEAQAPRSRHADLAASAQIVLEERALELARRLHGESGSDSLVLGGAVAANPALVTRLAQDGPFEFVHAAASPDKSGAALGAAWIGSEARAGNTSPPLGLPAGLGRALTEPDREFGSAEERSGQLADWLTQGRTCALLTGQLPFGQDLRGQRVALASPALEGAAERLRSALGQPEAHRPQFLLVPQERLGEWFETRRSLEPGTWLLAPRTQVRDRVPEALGPDGRVLVGAVPPASPNDSTSALAELFGELERRGQLPALLAMPFALRGSPLPRTEQDAVDAFGRTQLHALVCERRVWRNE